MLDWLLVVAAAYLLGCWGFAIYSVGWLWRIGRASGSPEPLAFERRPLAGSASSSNPTRKAA